MKKIFIFFCLINLTFFAFSKEWVGLKDDPISVRCTSDNKVHTFVFADEHSVQIRQELYEWDISYHEPIRVESYLQKSDFIEIKYTQIHSSRKDELQTRWQSKSQLLIDRLTGYFSYTGENIFKNFSTESRWNGKCDKTSKRF